MATITDTARDSLLALRNSDGGWAYARGKRSRLESTCWALLAVGAEADFVSVLEPWKREGRWLVDVAGAPVNYAFNALAALVLMDGRSGAPLAEALVDQLVDVKGKAFGKSEIVRQDNSIQAWGWVEETASWVEPTAWSLLALKKRLAHGPVQGAAQRIEDGDRMLFDRVCRNGGWNYGNANVFGKDLWAYVPTTALALLALQDRRNNTIVQRSLTQMRADLATERSVLALGLALICLRVYGAETASVERDLTMRYEQATTEGGPESLATAVMLCALSEQRWRSFTVRSDT